MAEMECPPIGAVIEECVESKRFSNRRPRYIDELARLLRRFCSDLEDLPLSFFTARDIENWLAANTATPGSRKTAINRLSALFSFARRRGYVEANPLARIEQVSIEARPPRIFSPNDADRFMNTVRIVAPSLLPDAVLGLYAGIRSAELERLDWSCIDLDRGLVRIDAAASKVRRRRLVPLEPKAKLLLDGLQGMPIAVRHYRKLHPRRRIAEAMEWPEIPHNILRHSAASYLLALHRDAGKVALMLGNSPGILLSVYYELVSPDDCAKFWACKG